MSASPQTTTRILAVGALAGAEAVWRTLLNVLALDTFTIDAAVQIGGLGVSGETEAAWRALADERLADSAIPLVTLPADAPCGPLALPAGAPAVSAGNEGVRSYIERASPKLAICGGGVGAESRRMWLGETLCLDPGSRAMNGALTGWVADLSATGVLVARRVQA